MTNLGDRIKAKFVTALDALDGTLKHQIDANSTADQARDALLAEMGARTSALDNAMAALQSQVNQGQTIDPVEFARVRDEIISISNAFPEAEAEPAPTPEPETPANPQAPEVGIGGETGFTGRRTNRL